MILIKGNKLINATFFNWAVEGKATNAQLKEFEINSQAIMLHCGYGNVTI